MDLSILFSLLLEWILHLFVFWLTVLVVAFPMWCNCLSFNYFLLSLSLFLLFGIVAVAFNQLPSLLCRSYTGFQGSCPRPYCWSYPPARAWLFLDLRGVAVSILSWHSREMFIADCSHGQLSQVWCHVCVLRSSTCGLPPGSLAPDNSPEVGDLSCSSQWQSALWCQHPFMQLQSGHMGSHVISGP